MQKAIQYRSAEYLQISGKSSARMIALTLSLYVRLQNIIRSTNHLRSSRWETLQWRTSSIDVSARACLSHVKSRLTTRDFTLRVGRSRLSLSSKRSVGMSSALIVLTYAPISIYLQTAARRCASVKTIYPTLPHRAALSFDILQTKSALS